MSETNTFQLDQFYFGNLIIGENRASATAGVVARTPRITPEQATECVQLAKLRPPISDEASEEMPSALGIFRGGSQSADYILVRAQRNDAGLPQVQFILLPLTTLRHMGGNVLALHTLGMTTMPSFSEVDPMLSPFELSNPGPPTLDEQSDALMDLLLYCKDSFPTVEGILAAIVQGWPLAIVNSPPALKKRLQFLQGLLSLLPTPARSGITFATHVSDFETGQAQIKFASRSAMPDKHVVFDWDSGSLLSSAPQDSYSRYILAQLRLDPSLVVQETERLARTAVWRAMHRENLGKALEWVSRRAALDQTVRDGQPADRQLVAAVLREDPTLPDDLRQVYVRHLLAFALALKEPNSADVIAAQCATYPDLTAKVLEQLRAAIDNNQPRLVYSMLERWILRVPEGAGVEWQPVLHTAATTHLRSLLQAQQHDQALKFLTYLRKAPQALQMREVIGDLIRITSEATPKDPDFAPKIFLLGAEYLPSGDLQRLITDSQFVNQLPQPIQTALSYLQDEPLPDPPENLLHDGARAFGDGYRMLVLTRLVELAILQRRSDLIDTSALQALLVMTQSPRSERFDALITQVIDDIGEVDNLRKLTPPGPRILIQLILQTHDYQHAVAMLEYYQNSLFGTDRLGDFTALVGELFRVVALPPDEIIKALAHFENSQIRPAPRAMIYTSVLANRQWSTEVDYAAKRLTTIIFNDYTLISTIGRDNMLKLLEYYARPRHALDTLRVAAALIDHTVHMGIEGAALITRMWPLLTWDEEVTSTAIELLRRYIRGVPMRKVPTMVSYFHKELGSDIGDILYATYIMRFVVDESDLQQFSEHTHTANELFADIATVYHTDKELPTNGRLRHDLDTMTGGLNDLERQQVADNLLAIANQIYALGTQVNKSNRQQNYLPFVQGKAGPGNSVELLYFIGGHFGQREVIRLDLKREEMAHLFGTRSAAMLLRETNAITKLLHGLQLAAEQLASRPISPKALRAELNSLWDTLSLYNKRMLQDQLANDCQQLPAVVELAAQNTNERALGENNIARQLETGRRQPQTAIETLRWIHGYFARKHSRG